MPKKPTLGLSYKLRTASCRTEYSGTHTEGLELLFVALPDALARRKMLDELEKTHHKMLAHEDRLATPDVEQTTAAQVATLARCAASRDGECKHAQCPQLRDNEPATSGRHCPLDLAPHEVEP